MESGGRVTVEEVVLVTADDMPEIRSWFEAWKLPVPSDDWFSGVGLWVPHIAAVWLYGTDSAKAYVDDTISNPNSVGHRRSQALMSLGVALEETGKRLGYRYLVGLTKLESMAMRMEVAGWRPAGPHRIFVKDVEAI